MVACRVMVGTYTRLAAVKRCSPRKAIRSRTTCTSNVPRNEPNLPFDVVVVERDRLVFDELPCALFCQAPIAFAQPS